MIRERIEQVRERIEAAALRCGRRPEEITLVAVSKTKPASDILAAYEAGQRHFGENYLQDFLSKNARLANLDGAVFHFIGKLQSNKTTPVAEHFGVIHTVDSQKLARRLDRSPKPLGVFVEVQLATEQTKGGVAPDDAQPLIDYIRSCGQLSLSGLMCIPPWSADPEQTRPYFARLRELAEALGVEGLSMGMSHDFEAAIEEGATHVRVGTAIFGKRQPKP